MIKTWGVCLVYLFECCLFLLYAHPFLKAGVSRQKKVCVGVCFIVAYFLLKYYLEKQMLLNIFGMVALCAVYFYLLGGVPKQNGLWMACVFAICVELGRMLVYGTVQLKGITFLNTSLEWPLRLLCCVLKAGCVLVFRQSMKKYAFEKIGATDFLMMIVPFAYLIFMRARMLSTTPVQGVVQRDNMVLLMLGAAALLAIVALLLHVSTLYNSRQVQKMQQTMDENYALTIKKQELDAEVMRMYHDIKHQVMALATAKDEQERDDIASKLLCRASAMETMVYSGNATVDSIVSGKARQAQKMGMCMQLFMEKCDFNFMDAVDLCSVFGNALDNALEGTVSVTEKEMRVITVKSAVLQGIWVLKVENPYQKTLTRTADGYLSDKKDGRNHGIGLQSIRYCAEKYNGHMEIADSGKVFTLRVMVPVLPEK